MTLLDRVPRWCPLPAGALLITSLPLFVPGTLGAQSLPAPLQIEVRAEDGGVRVELGNILAPAGIQRSLEAGLPVRVGIVLELWRDRFFDSQEGRFEWRATVRYDPLGEGYRVETAEGVLGEANSPEAANELLQEALAVPLRPSRSGRYYYLARLEIETLSLSDVEELRRWLRGELGPAVEGDREVGGAIGRGLRRLLVRSLGLPAQRYQTRSPRFDWEN